MKTEMLRLNAATVRGSGGDSKPAVILIHSQPGHPPDLEVELLELLKEIHAQARLDWIYAAADPHHVEGVELEPKEMNFSPYRAFPDKDITRGIAEYFVKSGMASALFGFGKFAEPAIRAILFDDWFGRTLARDALHVLDLNTPRMMLALSLLPVADRAGARWQAFIRLLQLEFDWTEYVSTMREQPDVHAAWSALLRAAELPESGQKLLLSLASYAAAFYDGTARRTKAVMAEVFKHVRTTSAERVAVIVDAPFASIARDALLTKGMSFLEVFPRYLSAGSMLDAAAELLGEKHRNKRLEQLFSGERVQSDVELVFENDLKRLSKERAEEWSTAARSYLLKYEASLSSADLRMCTDCVDRALGLQPDLPAALWVQGMTQYLQRRYADALVLIQRAIDGDFRNPLYWRCKALALQRLGRSNEANRCYAMAIYLRPNDGSLWGFLGMFLHEQRKNRGAGYCFMRGKELKDSYSGQNYELLCGSRTPNIFSSPVRVLPVVVRAMNRVILPLRHGWDGVRFKVALWSAIAFFIALVGIGAFVGARAEGIVGGIVGGGVGVLVWLVAVLVFPISIYINVLQISAFPRRTGIALRRVVAGSIGGYLGLRVAAAASDGALRPIWMLITCLLGAVVCTAGWVFLMLLAVRQRPKAGQGQPGQPLEPPAATRPASSARPARGPRAPRRRA